MGMEYAGAVDVDPPYCGSDVAFISDNTEWVGSRDGARLRPRPGADPDEAAERLRSLLELDDHRLDGVVAAYDDETGVMLAISVRNGKVTRRTLRKARAVVHRDNVIDLASRRRSVSRAISTPIA
ncbi:MAG TPA: hypothetical protein VGK78_16210 [Nocardioides sp.]|uniref:hypothetical protein n=1 Tax=Nocardioides sp. TaxID=35761 RepID=UPI002F3E4E8F